MPPASAEIDFLPLKTLKLRSISVILSILLGPKNVLQTRQLDWKLKIENLHPLQENLKRSMKFRSSFDKFSHQKSSKIHRFERNVDGVKILTFFFFRNTSGVSRVRARTAPVCTLKKIVKWYGWCIRLALFLLVFGRVAMAELALCGSR